MCYYIGIEDLAANAMIEILKRKPSRGPEEQPSVTFRDLESYGSAVVKYINKKTSEKAMLILSRASTVCMFRNYSEFFEETEDEHGIKLREGKTVRELEYTFRTYKAIDLINAYTENVAVEKLYAYYK